MSFVYSGANLFQDVDHPIKRQTLLFGKYVTKGATVEVLHHQISDLTILHVGEAKVSNVDYIGMSQATGGSRFTFKSLDKFLVAHELRRRSEERRVGNEGRAQRSTWYDEKAEERRV